jgi:hypothetical protein
MRNHHQNSDRTDDYDESNKMSVYDFLKSINMEKYETQFVTNGYDDIYFLV